MTTVTKQISESKVPHVTAEVASLTFARLTGLGGPGDVAASDAAGGLRNLDVIDRGGAEVDVSEDLEASPDRILVTGPDADIEEAAADEAEGGGASLLTRQQRAELAAKVREGLAAILKAENPGVFSCTDDPTGAVLQALLAERAQKTESTTVVAGVAFAKFDPTDHHWETEAGMAMLWEHFFPHKFRFLPFPKSPTPLASNTRIAILGDWGTGSDGAKACAQSIMKTADFGAIIHLGDVYYAGFADEIQIRFLDLWPRMKGAVNRACNSNHEMLSGGSPYVEQTLKEFHQSSSVFWLESDHWTLLGIDTAYDDGTVSEEQAIWIHSRALEAHDAGRGVLLFSHHPAWSTLHRQVEVKLADALRKTLDAGLVTGWYWGHEHLCSVFDKDPAWGMRATCVGHSGFAYLQVGHHGLTKLEEQAGLPDGATWYRREPEGNFPAFEVLRGDNKYLPGHLLFRSYGPNGYATLHLRADALDEEIRSADGDLLHQRSYGRDG